MPSHPHSCRTRRRDPPAMLIGKLDARSFYQIMNHCENTRMDLS